MIGTKKAISAIAVSFVFLTAVFVAIWGYSYLHQNNMPPTERFSLEPNTKTDNLSEAFKNNWEVSKEIVDRFFTRMTEEYGVTDEKGTYTVNGIRAENYPPYFAGFYINIDGQLIVQIKEEYFSANYRESKWYERFSEIVGSEAFFCHPVKYSYTDLMNAVSDIMTGDLSREFADAGYGITKVVIDDCNNRIDVKVRDEKTLAYMSEHMDHNLYTLAVTDEPEQTYENAPYPRKDKQPKSDEVRLEELKLDPLAGYYMNTPTEEGLTVCVWKCVYGYEPGKGEILCGLLPRQLDKIYNPEPTEDMASMGLGLGGFSPEDMKIILSTFDIPKEKISVIPWSNQYDSVGACSRPTTTEVGEVKEYLLGK